jgi:hypothetical protein
LCLLAVLSVAAAIDIAGFVKEMGITSKDTISQIGLKFLTTVRSHAEAYLSAHPEAKASEYPYFNFIPMWRASVVPEKKEYGAAQWSASCFPSNKAIATTQSDGSIQIVVSTAGPAKSDSCYDHYMLFTNTGMERMKIEKEGITTVTYNLPADINDAEKWDIAQKGVRILEILTDEPTTVANLLQTVLLFVPEFTQHVDSASAALNVDFLNRYTQIKMVERDPLSSLPPPAEKVHSGDFFGIIRLDGLDPMLAWAMGSTTGHTTTALWIDGELYICESTAVGSYWPTNGLQKTPYLTWLKQAQAAGFNVVWAPLNAHSRSLYNETAALEFFRSVEGFDYGYYNMLWGWIDTLYDNYPCVAPDYSSVCLTWDAVEPVFAMVDRIIPQISDLMYNQAWNKRLGTVGLHTAQLYQAAAETNQITSRAIPTIVEQDEWTYNTTRYGVPAEGPSLVCCVFVCNMWKASGLFGDMDINCAEQTNLDDYSLQIFESSFTQIMGKYTLDLNRFNSKIPFPHMAETCASLGPYYQQGPQC